MKLATKPVAPKPVSRADEDAYFDALGAATELRQRNEPHEKQVERANQVAYRAFIENHAIAEHEQIRKRGNIDKGILTKQHGEALRQNAIVDHLRVACAKELAPKVVNDFVEHYLKSIGFDVRPSTVKTDLAMLRKIGAITR